MPLTHEQFQTYLRYPDVPEEIIDELISHYRKGLAVHEGVLAECESEIYSLKETVKLYEGRIRRLLNALFEEETDCPFDPAWEEPWLLREWNWTADEL